MELVTVIAFTTETTPNGTTLHPETQGTCSQVNLHAKELTIPIADVLMVHILRRGQSSRRQTKEASVTSVENRQSHG